MADLLQTARGTKDILPEDQRYFQWIVSCFVKRAHQLGFQRIETPTFEFSHIFARAAGETSDIVEKEMYEVRRLTKSESKSAKDGEDSEKDSLVLRPEGTAAVARAYIEHGMQTWPQPIRLYYIESMFRYDRPQKGRLREHHQLGLEYFGDSDPSADAMILLLYWQVLLDLSLSEGIVFNLNSLGDATCRPKYRKKLKAYFEPYKEKLCPDCQRRLATNPLRILDCKEEACQAIAATAPILLDELCTPCKDHLNSLLEHLDELGITYNITPRLVRGLDYYSRTVFEVVDVSDTARQSSISGGGRYDGLMTLFGAKETPAVGTGIGIERLIDKLRDRGIEPPTEQIIKVIVVPLGDKAKKAGLKLIQQLNAQNIGASGAFAKESLNAQLKYADKIGAPLAIIMGAREVFDRSLIIRDMKTGVQDTVSLDVIEKVVKERLVISS